MWQRFLTVFALTFSGAMLAAAAAIVLIDPLAISPLRVVSDEILPQTDRRYIVPAIVRGRRHDSYIIGTSKVHLFDPKRFDALDIGRFANLSLFAATPYEQLRLVQLIIRSQPDVKNIIWGIDRNWCSALPPARYTPQVEFPEWLYNDDRLGHLAHAFNWGAIDLARRKVEQALYAKDRRLRSDGFLRIMPADSTYDPGRSRKLIWGEATPVRLEAVPAPVPAGSTEAGEALAGVGILRDAVAALPSSTRTVFVLLPSHARLLPEPLSAGESTLQACKAAIARLAQLRKGWVIDAMWRSQWAVEDGNFWDALHFRDRVADGLVAGIGAALQSAHVLPDASMRVLVRGPP